MKMFHDNSPSLLEQLAERVRELERRVSELEHPSQVSHPLSGAPAAPAHATVNIATEALAGRQSGIFPVLGTAVMGIAGAYLLRAVSESRVLPQLVVLAIALTYAAAWLIWAAVTRAQARFARNSYAITSVLILSPMLWEVTVRFRILDPQVTAVVLSAFAFLAMTLAWHRNLSYVVWVGVLAAAITAVVLMIATRALVPFTLALLFMALLVEFAACRGRWFGLRPIVAVAVDLAVLFLIIVLGNPEQVSSEFQSIRISALIGIVAALFGIYAGGVLYRSLALRLKLAYFEAAQLTAAAALAAWGSLRITNSAAASILGVFCTVVGGACYLAAFRWLERRPERRNFHFYSIWGLAFMLLGGGLLFSSAALAISTSLIAIGISALAVSIRSRPLGYQSAAYLTASAVSSGLLTYSADALVGARVPPTEWLVVLSTAAALFCAILASRFRGEQVSERILRLYSAILTIYAGAALAVVALVSLIVRGTPPRLSQLDVLRAAVICATVLLLSFIGSRWKRAEFITLAYSAVALGSVKFVVEDLRFGSTRSLALSLFIYGVVLILIPRLARVGARAS
jgi:hypothetical protein